MGIVGRAARLLRPRRVGRPRLYGLGVVVGSLLFVATPQWLPALDGHHELPGHQRYSPADTEAAADRDMVIRVHLACLWEIPAGALAEERGSTPIVQSVGTQIHDDHVALDEADRAVATQLGITLPDHPSNQQQDWLNQLNGEHGLDFDNSFAWLLRQAHGLIFPVIAGVRAETTNPVVRQFAETGVNIVMKHMRLLESTNLVDYSSLTPAPHPALNRVPFSQRPALDVLFVWIVVAVALLGGALSVIRIVRPR
jgi:putative membrane protein